MGKKCKVKTSKVAKVSKTSKKSNEQKIGEDEISRIRPEDTHGAVCRFATTAATEPYNRLLLGYAHNTKDKCKSS